MKAINPYLIFDGNCREAMEFYAKALGAEVHIMSAKDMPNAPDAQADGVMHARLASDAAVLMASDDLSGRGVHMGNNAWVSVNCSSREEEERMFAAMREGGTVTMELQDTFWGAYFGMLRDRFGVHWMFNFDKDAPDA